MTLLHERLRAAGRQAGCKSGGRFASTPRGRRTTQRPASPLISSHPHAPLPSLSRSAPDPRPPHRDQAPELHLSSALEISTLRQLSLSTWTDSRGCSSRAEEAWAAWAARRQRRPSPTREFRLPSMGAQELSGCSSRAPAEASSPSRELEREDGLAASPHRLAGVRRARSSFAQSS
jgi:hypothetical protein